MSNENEEVGRHKTNTEMLTELMEFARSGPLMQGFVLQAIDSYAQAVIAAGPERIDSGLISGHAWHACALEAKRTIDAHLGS